MKVLLLRCDKFSYKPIVNKLHLDNSYNILNSENFENCHVCLTVFQKKDRLQDLEKIYHKVSDKISLDTLVVYPYIHLSSKPKSVNLANKDLITFINLFKNNKLKLHKVPFGWKKTFSLELNQSLDSELFFDSNSLKDIQAKIFKPNSRIFILNKDLEIQDSNNLPLRYRLFQNQNTNSESIGYNQFFDFSKSSDIGNYILKPISLEIINDLKSYISDLIKTLGYCSQIKTPIILNLSSTGLDKYIKKFPTRYYQIGNSKKNLGLRFAACPGTFSWVSDKFIDSKNLPFGFYEFAECFRNQQTGEVKPLNRHKNFLMPDLHVFCHNIITDVELRFLELLDLIIKFLKDFQILDDIIPILRMSESSFKEHSKLIQNIFKKLNIPICFQIWQEDYFYFKIKFQIGYLLNNDILQISTLQIDSQSSSTYNIRYNNPKLGKVWSKDLKPNNPVILHCSLTGSIDRLLGIIHSKNKPIWILPTKLYVIKLQTYTNNLEFLKDIPGRIKILNSDFKSLNKIVKSLKSRKFKDYCYYTILGELENSCENLELKDRYGKSLKIKKDKLIELYKNFRKTSNLEYINFDKVF
jgi:threonyl-tRNA synthetase